MKSIFKKLKLFFYSFLLRKMFLSNILKINILTIDLMNYTGLLKTTGATVGAVCGTALVKYGIPPSIGQSLGLAVGSFIGNKADEDLKSINDKLKIVNDRNNKYLENEKFEKYLIKHFDSCINNVIDVLIKSASCLSKEDMEDDDKILSKMSIYIYNNSKSVFENIFFAELMSNEKIRENLIKFVKKQT